jgi:hypothetical protein
MAAKLLALVAVNENGLQVWREALKRRGFQP